MCGGVTYRPKRQRWSSPEFPIAQGDSALLQFAEIDALDLRGSGMATKHRNMTLRHPGIVEFFTPETQHRAWVSNCDARSDLDIPSFLTKKRVRVRLRVRNVPTGASIEREIELGWRDDLTPTVDVRFTT